MHLKNEDETRQAIERWRSTSNSVQTGSLRRSIESMELDQMHYELKGNSRGIDRCNSCLLLLQQRLAELGKTDNQPRQPNG